jgi:SNF2 family DNA or RNA helicase
MAAATIEAPVATDDAIADVARVLVESGRVVPGLSVDDDGRARSWWWPLPTATQRGLIASIVSDPSPDGQRAAAHQLEQAVDQLVRARLATVPVPRLRGRPSRATVWFRSLTSSDPWLPTTFDVDEALALATAASGWVRSGAVVGGRVRLCLRIHEPEPAPKRRKRSWRVELLAQDRDEPSMVVPLQHVWERRTPFGPSMIQETLTGLGRMARLAPELASALDEAAPTDLTVDDRTVVTLLRVRAVALDEAGIGLLLPAWWTRRPRLGLRARVRSAPKAVTKGGVGLNAIVAFEWEAALGDEPLTAADLKALQQAADAKQSLVRVRGQWVELDPGRIDTLLHSVGTRDTASASQLLRAGLGLDDLDAEQDADVLGVDASDIRWLHLLLEGALHARVEPIATPQGFDGELRPYQERGVGWLSFLGGLGLGACLADDMGLGKTPQLIANVLVDALEAPTLVVCPVSVLGNWERELARFAPDLRVLSHHGTDRHRAHRTSFARRAAKYDVVLTTYSLLARDLEHLGAIEWGRVVFDEAQQIKNPMAAQSKAAQALTATRKVALTGTPVENRLTELWAIMHVLNPGLLGSAGSFRDRFARPIEQEHDKEVASLLRRVTQPFVLRRVKTDRTIISDLPDKIETVDRCPLTREQASLYQAVVDDLLDEADHAEGISRRGKVLAGLLRLKQVCNHPAHFLADGSRLSGRSGKLTRTEELLEEILAEGDKVLCFTQFAAWGERLLPYFEHRFAADALWLHGGVRRKARDEMVQRFSRPEGPQLFLVSLKAGGTGLNLTAASHVIHLDRWWNPAVEDQATDRAYRIGQQRNVQVHKLVTTGTIEERIDEMITAKRNLAESIVGTGEEWLTELSTDELRDLVTLRDTEFV